MKGGWAILAAAAITPACVSTPTKCVRADGSVCPTPTAAATTTPTMLPPALSSPPIPSSAPQLVLPALGGLPVLGIPVGGNLYIPVTGGLPVIGIPTGP